jgi:hypothetical protein
MASRIASGRKKSLEIAGVLGMYRLQVGKPTTYYAFWAML